MVIVSMRDYRHFLFYAETIEADRVSLDVSETRHAAAALRRGPGDPFLATDGRGAVFECRVESIAGKRIAGLIMDRREVPRHACRLRLFAGIPERVAFETLVTSLTALGVERITPLVCRHCQGAWWERDAEGERMSDRFRKKMIAAMKQSLYPHLPRLDPPMPFDAVGAAVSGACIVADPLGFPLAEVLNTDAREECFSCLVGPPGGFAPEELASLKALGAAGVQLAPTRLTTELAAVVLCGQIIGARNAGAPRPLFSGPAA
ncbi:MAG: 16S rRNA (uracil(1498)-N(3))-methyltransferase [Chitinispirillaceae bacterium]|nr:16S rRNA (uracil(1498)-N(3))-methyltransferase [Chitinispirillaceae bacterium]